MQRKNFNGTDASEYELELQKTAHIRDAQLRLPRHDRLVSAPCVRRNVERTLDYAMALAKPGVYCELDEQAEIGHRQRIYQLEIDRQVDGAVRAYTEGRGRARALEELRRQQRQAGGGGTNHMGDVNNTSIMYVHGRHKQKPEIHDIDTPAPPADKPIDRVHDGLLDRDDDFTGLGIGGLDAVLLKA